MGNKNNLAIGLIIVAILVGAVFLLGNQQKSQAPTTSAPTNESESADEVTAEPQEESATESGGEGAVKEISMIAKQFDFDPATITVKQGEKVRITIKNEDVAHGFSLPDFGVNVNLPPGSEETVEFTADKKGEFTFFCSVFCGSGHRDMTGKLIVE